MTATGRATFTPRYFGGASSTCRTKRESVLWAMVKIHDLTGEAFGRLTALKCVGSDGRRRLWDCECSCGNRLIVNATALRTGHTKSCGCYKREYASARATIHGLRNTRLFRIWAGTRQRCSNSNNPSYPRYGGRGINVCPEWDRSFTVFYDWALANGYDETLTLERIDNDKGYSPENCRWATRLEQGNNKSNTVIVEFRGEVGPVSPLIRKHAVVSEKLVRSRLRKGWTAERALLEPLRGT